MNRVTALGVALLVFATDRTLKVLTNAGWLHGSLGWLQLIPLHNAGAMGGTFLHHRVLLSAVGILVVAALAFMWVRYRPQRWGWLYAVAWGLLFGAAVGNTFDRVVYGYVTDMFHLPGDRGIFNFADVSLQVGIVLMLLHVFLQPSSKNEHNLP